MNFRQFKNITDAYKPAEIMFIGMGNKHCSDDIAGLLLFEKLNKEPDFVDSNFINVGTTPENHVMTMINKKPMLIIFIDAVEEKNNKIYIRIYNSEEIENKNFSTHAYSIVFIEKFIKMHIDPEILYIGINIRKSYPGQKVSKEILQQINKFMQNE